MDICTVSSALWLLFWVGVFTVPIYLLILISVIVNRHHGAEIPTTVHRGLIFIFVVGILSVTIGLILHYRFHITC